MTQQTCPSECPLISSGSSNINPTAPWGAKNPQLLFVGDYPSQNDMKTGRAFTGVYGDFLRDELKKVGISRGIGYTSIVRCPLAPDTSSKDIKAISGYCKHRLLALIETLKPKCLVLVGDLALQQILNKKGISSYSGKSYWSSEFNCWCFPILHPKGVLRDSSRISLFEKDLKGLGEFVLSNYSNTPTDGGLDYVEDILKRADSGRILVSLDTETTGLDSLDTSTLLIGYSVSADDNKGSMIFLIDPVQETLESNMFETRWVYKEYSQDVLARLDLLRRLLEHSNVMLAMQHGSFDRHHIAAVFRRFKLPVPKVTSYFIDLQVAAHLLDEEKYRLASLDTLNKAFGNSASTWKVDMGGKCFEVDKETLRDYAIEDAIRTRQIAIALLRELKKEPRLLNYFSRFAMPAMTEGLFTLEANGVALDQDKIIMARFEIANRLERCEKELRSLIPEKVLQKHNGNDSFTRKAFVRDIFFSTDGFNLTPLDKTSSGVDSVTKGVISRLRQQRISKEAGVFIQKYEEWIKWFGLSSRSLSQLQSHIKSDGRIHSTYTSCAAVTGRVSSSSPNMMNVVARGAGADLIKSLITAPTGYTLLEADFSQAELRWIAHCSQDENMLSVYRRGEDIHLKTARAISLSNWDSLSTVEQKEIRTKSKSLNFGVVYGISPHGLSNYCQEAYGQAMTPDEAAVLIQKWFATYPKVKMWQKRTEAFAERYGFVESPLGRRRRVFKSLTSNSSADRGAAIRQAVNAPIQGASSDTCLLALITILRDQTIPKDIVKPVMFVHDSLTFEIKTEYLDEMAAKIYTHLTNPPLKEVFGVELLVPLEVDMNVGDNKAAMKEYKINKEILN